MECIVCGCMVDMEEKYCPNCGANIQKQISGAFIDMNFTELSRKYEIPLELLVTIESFGFMDQVQDNCIIYKDGVVDGFDSPDDLLKELEDLQGISEGYEDIKHVILDGKNTDFSTVEKVCIYKPDHCVIRVDAVISPDKINSGDYLAVLNDVEETVKKFDSVGEMAEWINKTNGNDLAMIFIKKEYYDWEIRPCFKIKDKSIEIDASVPF